MDKQWRDSFDEWAKDRRCRICGYIYGNEKVARKDEKMHMKNGYWIKLGTGEKVTLGYENES